MNDAKMNTVKFIFYRNPSRRSNAGTIFFGCSDIRLTTKSNTSRRFSSYGKINHLFVISEN